MKKKWSIIIESSAENMSQFDKIYFDDDKWKIPHTSIIGIMRVDEDCVKEEPCV